MAKLFVLLVVIAVIKTGYGLKCYSCESSRNAACNDPINMEKISLVECSVPPNAAPQTSAACMKIHTEDNHSGAHNVTRKCVTSPKNTDPCKTASATLDVVHTNLHHCSTCELDSCNSAFRQGALGYLVIALSATAIALVLKV